MEADQDRDGKISFDEFTKMVENTDVSMSMTLGKSSNPRYHLFLYWTPYTIIPVSFKSFELLSLYLFIDKFKSLRVRHH